MLSRAMLVATALLTSIGCTSYRSTIMSRQPNDTLAFNAQKHSRGVPVTLKVPTHVDVFIEEEYLISQSKGTGQSNTQIPDLGMPMRSVRMETVYTPKVMTVDFVRPVAGTLDIGNAYKDGIAIDDEQYFASIKGKIDDKTLSTINEQFAGITKILGITPAKAASAGGDESNAKGVESFRSTIAFRRFDINECNWEVEVEAFVSQHIQCQEPPCQAEVVPPAPTVISDQ